MYKISIISASVRAGRNSHSVTLYLQKFIQQNTDFDVQILDLKSLDFPVFEERLKNLKNPPANATEFAEKIKNSDGIIIVTPEYNGGYPASLKNVTDLLYEEWYHKPIAFAPVSSGAFGGTQVITSIIFSFWKMRALLVPTAFHVANVEKTFDEKGNASDEKETEKRAKVFIDELTWALESAAKTK